MELGVWLFLGMAVIVVAGFIQGLTSFGFALLSVPVLALMLPIKEVVPLVVLLSLVTNILILGTCFRDVQLRKIVVLILASLAATPLGVYSLVVLDSAVVKLFAGVVILVVALLFLTGKTFPVRKETLAFIPVGLASGFLNGSISMSGPPLALFLTNQGATQRAFRANITAYALILNVFTVGGFVSEGLIGPSVSLCLWMVPCLVVGVLLGSWATKKLNSALFRTVALGLIVASGVATIATTLLALRAQ